MLCVVKKIRAVVGGQKFAPRFRDKNVEFIANEEALASVHARPAIGVG